MINAARGAPPDAYFMPECFHVLQARDPAHAWDGVGIDQPIREAQSVAAGNRREVFERDSFFS